MSDSNENMNILPKLVQNRNIFCLFEDVFLINFPTVFFNEWIMNDNEYQSDSGGAYRDEEGQP